MEILGVAILFIHPVYINMCPGDFLSFKSTYSFEILIGLNVTGSTASEKHVLSIERAKFIYNNSQTDI